jgi:hypothetical membrane protein
VTGVLTPQTRPIAAAFAMIAVVAYVMIDIALQLLPPHYSAISQAESDLAVGPFGWIMSVNFVIRFLSAIALVVAILATGPRTAVRTAGAVLLTVAGLFSALIAVFPTDIPRTAGVAQTTLAGTIHLIGASTGFVAALAAFWVLLFWTPARSRASVAFLTVASVGFVALVVSIEAVPDVLGLTERVCVAGILGWVFVVARTLRRAG